MLLRDGWYELPQPCHGHVEEYTTSSGVEAEMNCYEYIAEPTSTGYSAYLPAVPGCVSTGRDIVDLERRLQEAVAVHLDLPIGEPIVLRRLEKRSA